MKLLRVTAQGLPLFKEKLDLPFYAQQRVAEEGKINLYSLFSNIYLNPSNAFIGINASGKTSVLKVLILALGIINNEPINHINTKDILGNTEKAVLNIYFYSEVNEEICRLETVITSKNVKVEGVVFETVLRTALAEYGRTGEILEPSNGEINSCFRHLALYPGCFSKYCKNIIEEMNLDPTGLIEKIKAVQDHPVKLINKKVAAQLLFIMSDLK